MSGARSSALDAMHALRRGTFSTEALDASIRSSKLDARDAALCERIVRATVQNLSYIDYVIGLWCNTPVKKLEVQVLDILRISVCQLLFLDRVPPSAAVNEAVELCRERGKARACALVNGVLRRVSEHRESIPEVPGKGSAEYLSVRYSHPLWLVQEFISRRGYDGAESLLAANNAEPPVTIQTNTLRTTPDAMQKALDSTGIAFTPGQCEGSFDLSSAGAVERIPGYSEGLFYVQDSAARLAVESVGLKPGMRVLDACSAPGGKSFAAAMLMHGEGEILACDLKEKRLKRVSEGAQRLGIDMITTHAMDAREPFEELHTAFDVVIADVPCSGFGVIRRKPEIRFKTVEETASLPEIQLAILSSLSRCVKPGGVLLYSTCTLLERENENVIRAFLGTNPGFTPTKESMLWPDINKTDGFFICRMVKST